MELDEGSTNTPAALATAGSEDNAECAERVLLINPPAYDTRLHWSQWLQPTLLLRLASFLRATGCEVKLIDSLNLLPGERLRRKRMAILDVDGIAVQKWRFGPTEFSLAQRVRQLKRERWYPDAVYIECLTTFWWEGVAEVTSVVKATFPGTPVRVIGAYAELAPEHAREQAKVDGLGVESRSALSSLPSDLSLYDRSPNFAYLMLGDGRRSVDAVVEEVKLKADKRAVQRFAFADHAPAGQALDTYRSVLEALASRKLKANFYSLGSVSPAAIVSQPDLPRLMKAAGYVQLCFSDDRSVPMDRGDEEEFLENCATAAALCFRAGFGERCESVVAGICVGRLGEDLGGRARLATLLAHHVGSVIVWPYQPAPDELPGVPLEEQNGKLFPLRAQNGYSFRDYLNVLGLVTVLNAKYRAKTFDFLGDGLIHRLFRDSVRRRAWDPDPEAKGALQLPLSVRR